MAKPGAIVAMERCLEQVAGKAVAARVIEGSFAKVLVKGGIGWFFLIATK